MSSIGGIYALHTVTLWADRSPPPLPSAIGAGSAAEHALRLDIEGIDRLAGGHQEPDALPAAETHIGAALGQHDAADHLAVGGVDGDPVLGLAAAPRAPHIAVDIDAQPIAAARLGAAELAPVGGPGGGVDDVVDLQRAPPPGRRGDDIEQLFVGREGEPVRPFHIAD